MKRTIYLYEKPNPPHPPSKHPTSQKRPNIPSITILLLMKNERGFYKISKLQES